MIALYNAVQFSLTVPEQLFLRDALWSKWPILFSFACLRLFIWNTLLRNVKVIDMNGHDLTHFSSLFLALSLQTPNSRPEKREELHESKVITLAGPFLCHTSVWHPYEWGFPNSQFSLLFFSKYFPSQPVIKLCWALSWIFYIYYFIKTPHKNPK